MSGHRERGSAALSHPLSERTLHLVRGRRSRYALLRRQSNRPGGTLNWIPRTKPQPAVGGLFVLDIRPTQAEQACLAIGFTNPEAP
jgi:hypothetical protein